MKIKPSADFSAIPAEQAIQQVEPDAPAMQAESVRRISVPASSDSRFVQDYPANLFPELRKQFNLKSGKTVTEDFSQIIISTQMNPAHPFFRQDAQMFIALAF